MLEAVRDVRVAEEALQQMERTFARAVEPSSVTYPSSALARSGCPVTRARDRDGSSSPRGEARPTACEARSACSVSSRELASATLLAEAPGCSGFTRHGTIWTAPRHCLRASWRLSVELPVLVTRKDGWRWWWYRDRFWWDDEGLIGDRRREHRPPDGPGSKAAVRCGRPSACGPPRRGRRASPGGARLRVGKTRSLASGSGPLRRLWLLRKRRVRPHRPDLAGRLRHGSERRAALPIVPRPVGPQRDAHESHARANRCSPVLPTRARVCLRGAFLATPQRDGNRRAGTDGSSGARECGVSVSV